MHGQTDGRIQNLSRTKQLVEPDRKDREIGAVNEIVAIDVGRAPFGIAGSEHASRSYDTAKMLKSASSIRPNQLASLG